MSAMIFIQNKYTKWYNSIIFNAQTRTLPKDTYIERHHIIPRSLGGDNSVDNLVKLLAREHFICHLLLIKMTEGKAKRSMAYAAWQMTNVNGRTTRDRYVPTSKMYEFLRKQLSNSYKGVPKNYASFLNKKHTEETKKKQSEIKQGKKNPMFGRKQSVETIAQIRLKQKGIPKPKFICEHCEKVIGGKSNYIRYHGTNCQININYDRQIKPAIQLTNT
jgi:NUMOD3 motif